ncbi:MAG: universal stress protein [Negativicoccus succinicivorans]|uniref:universal stress protein n=1 Tax=Negativicoccus succinicivorans TaxID=620903 RepID=UPI0029131D50|nr:universal stress protein [Negativicoccus succinicivorans]MDU4202567.1 universal stress protein [Negativicoccus succinicivorans]MDU5396132.1 universal stress protein [Negativicoccus succinicivorans]
MIHYNEVLLPADGSENGVRALQHAIELVKLSGGTLLICHVANVVSVISGFDQIPSGSGYVSEQMAEDLEEKGKEILEKLVRMVPADIPVKTIFEVGSPGPTLSAIAEKYNVDLIVMGSRGLGPLKGIFMGSVSSYIVSHAKCPVLIVK